MKSLIVVSFLFCSYLGVIYVDGAGAQKPSQTIGQKAEWQPGMGIMDSVRQECGSATDFGQCFVSQMQKSGASPEAIAFTKLIGNTGYMRDFRETGRVDVAYANYPFRANENQGCLLVNGDPTVIDIDDFNALPKSVMQKDTQYSKLVEKYPNLTIFPGDRNGTDYPKVEKLPNGGQRFVVTYRLLDGCHACARVGGVSFAFDFDSAGKLLDKKFLGVGSMQQAQAHAEKLDFVVQVGR